MPDTEWPRYEVFKQDRPNRPHEAVGTVHAPDPEMALLNARDVFVRRPACHSLWVAPQDQVLTMTALEMELNPAWAEETVPEDAPVRTFHVFTRQHQRRTMVAATHVGQIQARTHREALRKALEQGEFTDRPVYLWMIVPADAITGSREEDVESLFRPAEEKHYRDQSYYSGRVFDKKALKRREREVA